MSIKKLYLQIKKLQRPDKTIYFENQTLLKAI